MNGRSLPSIDNVYALSELFKVPMDQIICGNREYQPEQGSMYYRLKAYAKYLRMCVTVTCEGKGREAIAESRAFIYVDKEVQRVDKAAIQELREKM